MTARSERVKVPRSEARLHLDKAREFLSAASDAFDRSLNDAAMLGAIHAGIGAVDAVTVVLGGLRSADPDHLRAAVLLEEMGGSDAEDPRASSATCSRRRTPLSTRRGTRPDERRPMP